VTSSFPNFRRFVGSGRRRETAPQDPDGLPACKFWELDMTCGLDRFLEAQTDSGDDRWMERALPKLEAALNYIRSDPKHW
jgi:hypothetical protein